MTVQKAIEILKMEYLGDSEYMELAKQMGAYALEKQIPKKIKKHDKCPVCNSSQSTTWYYVGSSYCEFCGQALDWSDYND